MIQNPKNHEHSIPKVLTPVQSLPYLLSSSPTSSVPPLPAQPPSLPAQPLPYLLSPSPDCSAPSLPAQPLLYLLSPWPLSPEISRKAGDKVSCLHAHLQGTRERGRGSSCLMTSMIKQEKSCLHFYTRNLRLM